jgi:hypothetical protein
MICPYVPSRNTKPRKSREEKPHVNNSYIDVNAANDWCQNRGITAFTSIADVEKPKLLLRASEWIDQQFAFTGARQSVTQIRAWPRDNAMNTDGQPITGIPDVVIAAVIELCLLLEDDPDAADQAMGLAPAITQQKAGGIEIRYDQQLNSKQGKISALLGSVLRRRHDIRIVRG